MLSPLKSYQAMSGVSTIAKNQEEDKEKIWISDVYEYPKHYNFFWTPSTQYKHKNELKQSYGTFYFPVFDLSKMKHSDNVETKNSLEADAQKKQESVIKIPQYQFSLDFHKPEPFMGAFLQTQKQFDCFNLTIKIPSIQQMKPFSRVLSQSLVRQGRERQEKLEEALFNKSDVSEQISNDLFNLDLSVSKIDPEDQQKQVQVSNFWLDYSQKKQVYEKQHKSNMYRKMWESGSENKDYFNHAYQFHLSRCQQFIDKVESKILLTEKVYNCTEQEICSALVKMILGVESDLFKLQYHQLIWSVTTAPLKFQHMLRTSLENYLQDILVVANYKSRLDTALSYIKKQSYRRILQQVSFQTKQFLYIIQQVFLQLAERKASFLDCVLTLTQYKSSISLIYELLINESWIKSENKSYMDFDVSFLNSQAVIFRQIVRMSNNNDMLFGKSYQLCLKILRAAFKPITFTLNRIVFEEVSQISNRDDTYLRFYFENLKDLLSYLGKRIDLIKNESNQLYMICRRKQKIDIVVETNQLEKYMGMWNNLFATKRKMIERIQKREKKRLKQIRQKKEEEKIKEIYQLKTKLLKSIEETKKRKSEIYWEGVKQIQKLKKDIAERQERRRLNYLIQKEQEKGFLLDAQLRQKRNLIQQKQELVLKAEKIGLELMQKAANSKMIQGKSEPNIAERKEQKGTQRQNKNEEIKQVRLTHAVSLEVGMEESKQVTKVESRKEEQIQGNSQKLVRTISRISSISIPSDPKIQSSSESGSEGEQQQPNGNGEPGQQCPDIHVSTNTVLQLCIDTIIRQQIEITSMAMSYLVYDKYQLFSIMDFMHKIFLNANGQGLTNFIHLSITPDSRIGLHYFRDCLLFDIPDSFIRDLIPEFYQVYAVLANNPRGIHSTNTTINIFQDSLEVSIGFQFSRLPVLLQPYFSYIHLSKYMQIFSHILKVNHCLQLTSSCLLILNEFKGQKNGPVDSLLQKLYLTRHSIHIFLNTYQSYFFHRIIEKQLKILRTKLRNKDINQLAIVHLNMLDAIIRKGLIENNFNDISKKIKGLLMEIRKFKNIVDSYCANDIHSYVKPEIEAQVQNMFRVFREQQFFLQSLFYHP